MQIDSRPPLNEELMENGRIWLNTAAVADRLIRDFTREVLSLDLHRPDLIAMLDFLCRRMNNLFLGVTPSDKYLIGPWNAPDQLGEYILKALQINGVTRLGVRDAFMWYFDKVLDVYKPGAEFDAAPIEPLINQLRDALLGVSKGPYGYTSA